MQTSTREVDDVIIVDLSGRFTLGEGNVTLQNVIRDLALRGNRKILLNLADITYIDSSGIGALVSCYTTIRNRGGELKLVSLSKRAHDLLHIAKLHTLFDIKDDEDAAVKSFR